MVEKITSLEDKVAQLFMVHCRTDEEATTLIKTIKVGGVIYYNWANDLTSREKIAALSRRLQSLSRIPLLIAADQEGGLVARAALTVFPGNKALGMTHTPSLAHEAALAMGKELLDVGINTNLAPVVDVKVEPRNPCISIRAFSADPEEVAAFGREALIGYQEAHVIPTLKHFPGHGDVTLDSHLELPIVNKPLRTLEQTELLPFKRLAPLSDMIMTAHLMVPALDPDHCSTVSKNTLDYLRNELHFKGVIITDSLVMQGVLKECGSIEEAAIQSLNAGVDLLLFGGRLLSGDSLYELKASDIERIHHTIVQAIRQGRIAESRIDEALSRVLSLKEKYLASAPHPFIDFSAHVRLAQKIAKASIQKIGTNLPSDWTTKQVILIAPKLVQKSIEQTTFLHLAEKTQALFFSTLNPKREEIDAIKVSAQEGEILIAFSYQAWSNPSQQELIQSLLELGKPFVLVTLRDPLDATPFPEASLTFNTFSPTSPSIQAVAEAL